MSDKLTKEPIRIGVFGAGRGKTFAHDSELSGVKLAAVCDQNEGKLEPFKQMDGVSVHTDFDQFLQADIDAVVIANYFHQHAPYAIRALAAGKHVMSETSACKTIKEGVELVRAVEKSGKIYMFAENYPYFTANMEMRELYKQGKIGEIRYAEGAYVHPMPRESQFGISPGLLHWRNQIPSTYYCTHSLAPLMHITDTMPIRVNALSIADPEQEKLSIRVGDPASVILCRMDNGAVFRLYGMRLPGHGGYRLTGSRGMMETIGGNVRIVLNEWELQDGEFADMTYKPKFRVHDDIAKKAGHGGGDFWTTYYFAEAIRTGQQPYLNVYRGVAMSVVGILGWKSALQEGVPFAVPDFSKEEERRQHEHDDWSPWPEDRRPGQPWPSIRGQIVPSDEAVSYAEQIWKEKGYTF